MAAVDLTELFQRLYDSPWAVVIRENDVAFPWIECLHVLAISVVVGSISVVDLRLLGLAWRDRPVGALLRHILPITWIGFALAAASGFVLFASNAPTYARNPFLQLKMGLLVLAGVNMTAFHLWSRRNLPRWESAPLLPFRAKLAGAVSLLCWIGIVAAGRWIGFTNVSHP
jgi:uncharacterized protein DUF6644